MAYFAKVVDGIVQKVISAEPDFFENFIDDSPGEWIQTSYNTIEGVHYNPETRQPSEDQSKALRKNFAGPGFIYDKELDAFYPPKPFESWTLDTEKCQWQPPIPYPDGPDYYWEEDSLSWKKID